LLTLAYAPIYRPAFGPPLKAQGPCANVP